MNIISVKDVERQSVQNVAEIDSTATKWPNAITVFCTYLQTVWSLSDAACLEFCQYAESSGFNMESPTYTATRYRATMQGERVPLNGFLVHIMAEYMLRVAPKSNKTAKWIMQFAEPAIRSVFSRTGRIFTRYELEQCKDIATEICFDGSDTCEIVQPVDSEDMIIDTGKIHVIKKYTDDGVDIKGTTNVKIFALRVKNGDDTRVIKVASQSDIKTTARKAAVSNKWIRINKNSNGSLSMANNHPVNKFSSAVRTAVENRLSEEFGKKNWELEIGTYDSQSWEQEYNRDPSHIPNMDEIWDRLTMRLNSSQRVLLDQIDTEQRIQSDWSAFCSELLVDESLRIKTTKNDKLKSEKQSANYSNIATSTATIRRMARNVIRECIDAKILDEKRETANQLMGRATLRGGLADGTKNDIEIDLKGKE